MRLDVRREGLALAVWLSFLALILRALVPAGYMLAPDPASGGAMRLLPCYGIVSPVSLHASKHIAAGHEVPVQGPDHKTDSPCAFAGSGTPTSATEAVWLAPRLGVALLVSLPIVPGTAVPRPPASSPPSTGPPVTL